MREAVLAAADATRVWLTREDGVQIVLARERISELALYRALGARCRQIFRVFLGKGLGMALFMILELEKLALRKWRRSQDAQSGAGS